LNKPPLQYVWFSHISWKSMTGTRLGVECTRG
jgi:hypothetical protein